MNRTLKLSEIRQPPFAVTLPVKAGIDRMARRLELGLASEPVVVSEYGGNYYAISNLDVLEAYRARSARAAPCVITRAASRAKMIEMQLANIRHDAVNPIAVMDALSGTGKSSKGLPAEYRGIESCRLSDEARAKFTRFVGRMCDMMCVVPNVAYILWPLSRLDVGVQAKALDAVIRYSIQDRICHPPDRISLDVILAQFDAKAEPEPDMPGPDAGAAEQRSECGGALSGFVRHDCACGRSYLVDLKNRSIREVQDGEEMMVLTGEHGGTVFSMPERAAQYLELAENPPIRQYPLDGRGSGDVIMLSKRPIPRKKLAEIRGML